MSTNEKLIERFRKQPKDFIYNEMVKLLVGLGYKESNKGKTSGSRVRFVNKELKSIIDFHKPHPGSIIKESALKDILKKLLTLGVI